MELAIGWLGWSPEQAMSCDINAIKVGYRGRIGMLQAIFGGGGESKKSKKEEPKHPAHVGVPRTLTPTTFDSIFKGKTH